MKCCFAALLFVATGFAQMAGEATVSGRVTDAITHQPVAGATVLYCCVHRADAVSDADGRFSFHVQADGALDRITVTRKGYAQLDPARYFDKSVLRLKPGDAETLDLELSPAAHLTGHLVDRDSGKPLAGFVVIVAVHKSEYGFEYMTRPSGADGSFAIVADLNPGDYTLEIDPPATGKRSDVGYGRTWFPGVHQADMAAPVTVAEGENRDIELRLQERELHHIAGVIQFPEQQDSITITLVAGLRPGSPIAKVDILKPGPFRIEGLDPGNYRLTAATSKGFPIFSTGQAIELTDRDIEDLRLNLRSGVSVRAVVTMAEQNAETPGDLQFEPDFLFLPPRMALTRYAADPLYSSGYPPGEYWPELTVPKGYAIASVTFNGQPVANTTIDLEAPESTVDFVLTSRPAGLSGIVRDVNQNPIAEASVALLPELLPDTFERFDRRALQVVVSDARGAFRFVDLAPGRYRVVALTGGERQKARELVFLRERMRSAETVALDFGQTANRDLVVK